MTAMIRDTAAFFRLTLTLGWSEPRRIAAWAAEMADRYTQPDLALIDLSYAGDAAPDEIALLLDEVSWEHRPGMVARLLLAYIQRQYHAGSFHAEYIIPTLYNLVRSGVLALPRDLLIRIDDLQQALDDAGGDHDALDDIDVELLECLQWGDAVDRFLPDAYL